jgi:hypothetical protein
MQRTRRRYDVLIIDAFFGENIPEHMKGAAFLPRFAAWHCRVTRFRSSLSTTLPMPCRRMGMVTGLGIKTPFDYSVFSAAAAAFLLAFWEPDRFTLDKLLNRSRN